MLIATLDYYGVIPFNMRNDEAAPARHTSRPWRYTILLRSPQALPIIAIPAAAVYLCDSRQRSGDADGQCEVKISALEEASAPARRASDEADFVHDQECDQEP